MAIYYGKHRNTFHIMVTLVLNRTPESFEQGKPIEVRQAAGLLLKNNLRTTFTSMAPPSQQYIKSELLPCLGAADRHIRSTAGTIISVLVQIGGVVGWPKLLQTLIKCLDSNKLNHIEGAMDALSKVCTPSKFSFDCSLNFHDLALFL